MNYGNARYAYGCISACAVGRAVIIKFTLMTANKP